MTLKILIYPGEDGYFVAECPALPGCVTQGGTRDEALTNIREAIAGWLEVGAARTEAPQTSERVEIVEVAV